jgi:hypothetical protein
MKKLLLITLAIITLNIILVGAVEPFGAEVSFVNSSRAKSGAPTGVQAIAGNVTELNIFGYSTTRSWQGYFGNVTGTIQLADASSNVMYNWSVASPRGEVYASTNDSIVWPHIQCFNYTASGTFDQADESNPGGTNQFGMNLTQLHQEYNIEDRDMDSVEKTFNLFDLDGHALFHTNNLEFSQGQCPATRTFTDIGAPEPGKFEEALLYEPVSRSVVFAALLNEDVMGFNGRSHDFQMLVLEDGHGTNTQTTTYYFYVELY